MKISGRSLLSTLRKHKKQSPDNYVVAFEDEYFNILLEYIEEHPNIKENILILDSMIDFDGIHVYKLSSGLISTALKVKHLKEKYG